MKEEIVAVCRASAEFMIPRNNSFELYGADFMIDRNYHPWLIEVNCSPALGGTTSITKRLCREVCEDAMKVVVDRRQNPDAAGTGKFSLLFKEHLPTKEVLSKEMNYCALLKVHGTSVTKPQKNESNNNSERMRKNRPWKP